MAVIGMVSAKGGVGKTTLTANLGALIAQHGHKVLLVDGNITTPTLGLHFGIAPKSRTLNDVLENRITMEEAVYSHPCGVGIVPSSLLPARTYPDPEALKEKIRQVRDRYDYILIDAAAGIGREVMASMEASDALIVVSSMELTSAVSACKIIKLAEIMEVPVLGIIANKAFDTRHQMTKAELEELCERKVLGSIPFDRKIPESLHQQKPLVLGRRHSKASHSLRRLASFISGHEYEEEALLERIRRALSIW